MAMTRMWEGCLVEVYHGLVDDPYEPLGGGDDFPMIFDSDIGGFTIGINVYYEMPDGDIDSRLVGVHFNDLITQFLSMEEGSHFAESKIKRARLLAGLKSAILRLDAEPIRGIETTP